jgi:hypothetical protein
MLRDELVAIAEVGCEVPSDVIGAGHEHVDEVVDDDRHFRAVDRLEPDERFGFDADGLRHQSASLRVEGVRCARKQPGDDSMDGAEAGKSTLLQRVAAEGDVNGRAVIFVDIETLRGRPYPDVLIELLNELLEHLEERLRADGRYQSWRRRKLRRSVRDLSDAMSQLLQEPQLAEHTVSRLRSKASQGNRRWSAGGRLRARAQHRGVGADVGAQAQIASKRSQAESEQTTVDASFEKTKMDGLVEAATLIRGEVQEELAVPTLVVLDDFYHIPLDDQAEVLAYLHQVVKGLDINLKVCGVQRLLRPYAAGDPPVGMQPEHDAGTVPLDITLERFELAKQFLERVLGGICEPLGIELDRLLTDGGRERLVLASGGVARDHISLTRRALRNATERPSHQFRVKNRNTAEDVAQAATALYEQKQEELKRDAQDGADRLRSRLTEIVRFCVESHERLPRRDDQASGGSLGQRRSGSRGPSLRPPHRHPLDEAWRRDIRGTEIRSLHARFEHMDEHTLGADQSD